MYSPSRKDFISLTLSDPHSHTYNNGKHRRQSCWRVGGAVQVLTTLTHTSCDWCTILSLYLTKWHQTLSQVVIIHTNLICKLIHITTKPELWLIVELVTVKMQFQTIAIAIYWRTSVIKERNKQWVWKRYSYAMTFAVITSLLKASAVSLQLHGYVSHDFTEIDYLCLYEMYLFLWQIDSWVSVFLSYTSFVVE